LPWRLASGLVVVEPIERGANEESVMHRGGYLDADPSGKTASEAQHFGAVSLHREIKKRARSRVFIDVDMPAETRAERSS
jgi:hypothetical protein